MAPVMDFVISFLQFPTDEGNKQELHISALWLLKFIPVSREARQM
jgi:hypothetical protein